MNIKWIVRHWRTLALWRMPTAPRNERFYAYAHRAGTWEFGAMWLAKDWFLVDTSGWDLNTGKAVVLKQAP